MLIIPAIDIIDGKCVRLRQGDYDQKTVYVASPVEVAKQFADAGFTFLHIVDLQGAKEKRIVNWDSIASIIAVHSHLQCVQINKSKFINRILLRLTANGNRVYQVCPGPRWPLHSP